MAIKHRKTNRFLRVSGLVELRAKGYDERANFLLHWDKGKFSHFFLHFLVVFFFEKKIGILFVIFNINIFLLLKTDRRWKIVERSIYLPHSIRNCTSFDEMKIENNLNVFENHLPNDRLFYLSSVPCIISITPWGVSIL